MDQFVIETMKEAKNLLKLAHDYNEKAVLQDEEEELAAFQACVAKLNQCIDKLSTPIEGANAM
jgi:hypothetical protein